MRKFIALFILTLLCIRCSNTSELKLANDSTISSVFNPTEIEDLSKILSFFEHQICSVEKMETSNIEACYQSFLERIKRETENGLIPLHISFKEQKTLYQQIKDSTFNQIWVFNQQTMPNSNDTLKSIGLKHNGKYIEFLSEYGKLNSVIDTYYNNYIASGDLGPSMVNELIQNYQVYDLSQVNIRLIIAIHYLTLNDLYG